MSDTGPCGMSVASSSWFVDASNTVNVCAAIVNVPVRPVPLAFGATTNETDPFPVPFDPLVIDSQSGLFETASHRQLGSEVVTVTSPMPPVAPNV